MSDKQMQTPLSNGSEQKGFGYALIGLAVLVFSGAWMILTVADDQRAREIASWEARIDLIADSRVADASNWLNRSLNATAELSEDPSLQLYASELAADDTLNVASAQQSYIFSLISAHAERYGFYEESPLDAVAANVRRPTRSGIGIFATDGTPVVASRGMPVLTPTEWPRKAVGDLADPFITLGPSLEDRTPLVLFGAPIYSGEGSGFTTGIVAWVVAARPLDSDFLDTLAQPGALEQTAETYVVRDAGDGKIQSITPLKEGGRLLETRKDQASYSAVRAPGAFIVGTNYAGTKVLLTAREFLAPVDWVLIRSVSITESLEAVNASRFNLILTLSGGGGLVLLVLLLVWRLGVSKRLEAAYAKEAALSAENKALSDFLTSISNVQPSAMAAVSDDLTVSFANSAMGRLTGLAVNDLINRRLTTAFSKETAGAIQQGVVDAAAKGQMLRTQLDLSLNGQVQIFQTQFVPLRAETDGALPSTTLKKPIALIVLEDLTDLVSAQQRNEKLLTQLVATLTQIIDARDPWSKHHSARVAEVAVAITQERGLDDIMEETVRIAGQLVNLGKIFVPTEILTKETPLTDEEYALVRDSLQRGAALVYGLNFRGPVGATLAQFKAHVDGSGDPKGMTADDILDSAKILSVANAFVGMVSARAHRKSLGFDKTMSLLLGDTGTKYDRASVAALANVLENKNGRLKWSSYTEMANDKAADDQAPSAV